MSIENKYTHRVNTLLRHLAPNVAHVQKSISSQFTQSTQSQSTESSYVDYTKFPITQPSKKKPTQQKQRQQQQVNRRLIGFPRTTVKTNLFSRVMEKVYSSTKEVIPETDLVEMPKGEPPPIDKLYAGQFKSGHV